MVLWFRNDIRTIDNPALKFAQDNGVRDAIFFVTPKQWQEHHLAPIKIDFLLRHVVDLKTQLNDMGITLQIIEVPDYQAQVAYLVSWCQNAGINHLIANQELELNERTRDKQLIDAGIELTLFESDVIVPKGAILNKSGEPFKVFTPFKKAWLNYVIDRGFECELQSSNPPQTSPGSLEQFNHLDLRDSTKWPLASTVLQQVWPEFLQNKIDSYRSHRDFPGIKGTSGLSPYLAIGAISPRYLLAILIHRYPDILYQQPDEAFCWLNEIVWREFYRHLLHHYPALVKGGNFNPKYDALVWRNNTEFFNKWCEGKTGYPIVDAAMRQLLATGWMHNRLRMIVASFLTKHLLVDWRLGEQFFNQHLIDSDFAANNGGWQWSAGCGCDAQPYFRIFNPISQSEKFDPEGAFIRKYIPELASVPDKHIHFPHDYLEKNGRHEYWPAIVDHKTARQTALDFYKAQL